MDSIVKLGRHYDVEKLRADLEVALSWGVEHENRGDYHEGGWSAVALVSVDGSTDADGLRWAGWKANYQKTEIADACPYFSEIIDEFRCPKHRVRLLRLEPGRKINTHRDDGDGWAIGKVRLHIPIITHPEVYFFVDDQRVEMQPGELWYCDFTRPHRVHNKSDIGRIHLVLDLAVDDSLRDMFPPESTPVRIGNAARKAYQRARELRYTVSDSGPAIRAKGLVKRLLRRLD